MEKPEAVLEILENVEFVVSRCHLCPAEGVPAMADAVRETDVLVCAMAGVPFLDAPGDGPPGVASALFFLARTAEKVRDPSFLALPDESLKQLDNVVIATGEIRRALSV